MHVYVGKHVVCVRVPEHFNFFDCVCVYVYEMFLMIELHVNPNFFNYANKSVAFAWYV